MSTKKRVVILGGGVGAMTAAFQLTQFPDWQNRFDITVYQMGWRLGGKCASSRNPGIGERIEEHGLHVWAGFYDNAIKLMKQCYRQAHDAGIDGLFPSFETAFKPFNNIVLGEHVDGKWIPWHVQPPGNDAVPGEGGVYLSPWNYFRMAVDLLVELFEKSAPPGFLAQVGLKDMPDWLGSALDKLLPDAQESNHRLKQLHKLVHGMPSIPLRHDGLHHKALVFLLEQLAEEIHAAYAQKGTPDNDLRRFLHIADLAVAALKGVILDGVLVHGFDVIDDEEITAWLKKHGAHQRSLDSACVRAIYDYAFGFSHGTATDQHRAIAAGTSLRGMCRLAFTYKQAFFFEMQAGMGETVFTPFYKLLKQRGVKFKFFHKVTAIEAGDQSQQVKRIKLQRQADLSVPEYEPLHRVKDLDCWRHAPDYGQLQQGSQLQQKGVNLESSWADWQGVADVELQQGADFDEVILGISVAGLRDLCTDLAAKDHRWDDMLREIKTTRTLAMQLWLQSNSAQLGWPFGETILTCYEDNFNTWADLTHLLKVEDFPTSHAPGSVAYFCGPMQDDPNQPPFSDHGYPATQHADVLAQAQSWIETHAAWMWPQMVDNSGAVDWDQLVSLSNAQGLDRLKEQYFRANIDPSERYVLSVPGSTKYRIRSDQSGFNNLFLAGDWTYNGMNAGCVEAAAMSGMRAAAGAAQETLEIVGEDFAHAPPLPPQSWRPEELRSFRAQNQSWPWSSLYGVAQTSGANAVMAFPANLVAANLPDGLELAPQTLTNPGQHPVVMLFGWQDNVRPNMMPGGMDYREFIITIPYVQHTDPKLKAQVPGPLIYMPHLYLDKELPVWLGVYLYGYRKKLVRILADDDSYEIRNQETGQPMIGASYNAVGPTGSAMDYPKFRLTRAPYDQPLVSRTRFGWQYSFFDFALGQAMIQPVEMTIKIYDAQSMGLPASLYTVPSIQVSSLGGFFFSTSSTITTPLQSWHLKKLIRQRAADAPISLLPFP